MRWIAGAVLAASMTGAAADGHEGPQTWTDIMGMEAATITILPVTMDGLGLVWESLCLMSGFEFVERPGGWHCTGIPDVPEDTQG